jgi:hypothetical protein
VPKRVAIVQSNYIPWKGYFDLIASVDEFVLFDDRQFTRRDWRNRNLIKSAGGVQWLTIPVQVKGRYEQRIDETRVVDPRWCESHWTTLRHAYARAEHFADYEGPVRAAYDEARSEVLLSRINRVFIDLVCEVLGIRTQLTWSTDYEANGSQTQRLVDICRLAGASTYLSGPAARAYLREDLFEEAGICVEWMDYSGYPEYPQLYPPFEHGVTILDLIFNVGAAAAQYMKGLSRGD